MNWRMSTDKYSSFAHVTEGAEATRAWGSAPAHSYKTAPFPRMINHDGRCGNGSVT